MTRKKYDYAVAQYEKVVLHPDSHMFAQEDFYQVEPDIMAIIMTQLSLKTGLKAWGKRARDTAYSEMKQLHMRDTFDTFRPVKWSNLSSKECMMILESHTFLWICMLSQ
jgi:hypothetical protein